ncbi:MAG: aminotransferase class V-fold PLP-dependent enzyme [Acidimicrobiia bacterium]|nr:aminotransferase class V-fold PLP-dependent enzyme [Acidimicrobiia bacterium]
MRHHWSLDPDVIHLNHGSFGAVPNRVRDAQQAWRDEFDANPTHFVDHRYQQELDRVRVVIGEFVGADPAGLALVTNATAGMASIVAGVRLDPGDEIVVTDHGYNAVRNIVDTATGSAGARTVVASVPFPTTSPDQVVEAVLDAVSERTRLVIVDQVTSPTGLVFPVERIVAELEPEVPVAVDGAHAPGMLPLSVDRLGASFYTGNLHKWVCAPPGSGFLVVAERHRDTVRPPVISHGWNTPDGDRSLYHRLFDWTGTFDPSAWLSVPAAIETMADLHPGGWPGVMDANRRLALVARTVLCRALDMPAPAPDTMIGSMASVPVGSRPGLAERLRELGVVVPVVPWPTSDSHLVRVSAQLYNTVDDYERLAEALG